MATPRKTGDDVLGVSRLAVHATEQVVEVVEAMHSSIASGPAVLGKPLAGPVKAINGLVYGAIKGVTRLVGKTLEGALGAIAPLLGEAAPGPEREALLAALNGVVGDHLAATGNPLAIEMRLRHQGRALELTREALASAYPGAGGRVLVLIHGSSMNDLQWRQGEQDLGADLARELGFSPVYLHYNSGLHVSDNGRRLDELLEALVQAWPAPVTELVLLGHSMGGLVARAACAVAGDGRAWRRALTRLVTLGTPHHGAPLERGGSWVGPLLGVHRYSAPLARLAKLRSAGVTDLRFGSVVEADWAGRDRFAPGADPRQPVPLPAGVASYAVAATLGKAGAGSALVGDGLVPVDSALGKHADPARCLAFPAERQRVFDGLSHVDLLHDPRVHAALVGWLAQPPG